MQTANPDQNTADTVAVQPSVPPMDSTAPAGAHTSARMIGELRDEIAKVLVGQDNMVNRLIIGLLCGGHILLEGMPGLAKTLTVRALSQTIHTGFSRIQFTPDMLPADVIGTEIFNPREGTYSIKKGPVFSNLVLADEINRAPAKVQAALLEVMQERQVTIGGQSYSLEEPFLVLATQNPIEQEGTYPLPEAQIDRFMMKVVLDYPSRDEERKILDRMTGGRALPTLRPVATPADITAARQQVDQVFADDKVRDYVVDIVRATRPPRLMAGTADAVSASIQAAANAVDGLIEHGASSRATIWLMQAAKAHAFMHERNYVTPHDAKTLAADILRHRIMLSYEAEAEGRTADDVIRTILDHVLVP